MARKSKELEPVDKLTQKYLSAAASAAGMTQMRIAELTGISQNRIGIIFRLETPPATVGEVCAIAHAFNRHGSEFVERAESELGIVSEPVSTVTPSDLGLAANPHAIEPEQGDHLDD